MTSNTPPPITPNINTNPDSLQDDSNRPQVNVVSQPRQLTQAFVLISTPAQQRNHNNLEHDHEDNNDIDPLPMSILDGTAPPADFWA